MIAVLFIIALFVVIGALIYMLRHETHPEVIYYPLIEPRTITPRHYREEYENLGYIKSVDGEYPLWGLRSATRNHRWHYYTTNDPNHLNSTVQLPVSYSDRDCMEELGCDEIYDDEHVSIGGRSADYTVHLYR